MRRWFLAVGVVLTAAHMWTSASAATPGDERAAVQPVAAVGAVSPARLPTCEERYRRAVAVCTADGACRLAASDGWDICEATGFWPQ